MIKKLLFMFSFLLPLLGQSKAIDSKCKKILNLVLNSYNVGDFSRPGCNYSKNVSKDGSNITFEEYFASDNIKNNSGLYLPSRNRISYYENSGSSETAYMIDAVFRTTSIIGAVERIDFALSPGCDINKIELWSDEYTNLRDPGKPFVIDSKLCSRLPLNDKMGKPISRYIQSSIKAFCSKFSNFLKTDRQQKSINTREADGTR